MEIKHAKARYINSIYRILDVGVCEDDVTEVSYVRKESPILSLSWWGWGSCYESVVLGAPFTPAGITVEAERRVAHSISCNITL